MTKLKTPTKSHRKLNARGPATAGAIDRIDFRSTEDVSEVMANCETRDPNNPSLVAEKANGAQDLGTISVGGALVSKNSTLTVCDSQFAPKRFAGEIECLPSEQEVKFSDQLLNAAMVGLGVVAIAALITSSNGDEVEKRNLTQDTKSSTRKRKNTQLRVSQWLYELDKIKENTAIDRHSLSSETWDGVRKETDAIVLLGHLVSRDTALKASGYLGSEELLFLSLKKRAFLIAKAGFWGGHNYTAVVNFDQYNSQDLASAIENELFGYPVWEQSVGSVNRQRLKDGIQKIMDLNAQKSADARERYNEAQIGVKNRSCGKSRIRDRYYESVRNGHLFDIGEADSVQRAGASALTDLERGKIVSARKFLAKYLG